jgi:hypothetical protein
VGLFLVSYDLVKENSSHDYEPLTDALKELDSVRTQWSVWYVDSASDETTIYNYLFQFMDSNDRLMVVAVLQKPAWGKAFQGTRDMVARYFP